VIYAPDGRPLCEFLAPESEGVVYAEIDLGTIALAKAAAGPVGHYSRRDVTRLLLNRSPAAAVESFELGFESRTIDEAAGAPAADGRRRS